MKHTRIIRFYLAVFVLNCMSLNFVFAQNIAHIEYFIDTDPGFGNAMPVTGYIASANISGFTENFDLSSVQNGIHTLYVRAKDEYGSWSLLNSIPFMKGFAQNSNIIKAEYFIDNDLGFGNGINIPLQASPDVAGFNYLANLSNIGYGIHTLYVRCCDVNGKWSLTNSIPFLKQSIGSVPNIVAMEYFTDVDPGFGMGTPVTGFSPSSNVISFLFDVDLTTIPGGNHNLYIRVKDTGGSWSLTNIISYFKPLDVGISEIITLDRIFNVFPNPGNGFFTITVSENILPEKLEIINVSGEILFSEKLAGKELTVNISGFVDGMYFFRIIDSMNNRYYSKVLKE